MDFPMPLGLPLDANEECQTDSDQCLDLGIQTDRSVGIDVETDTAMFAFASSGTQTVMATIAGGIDDVRRSASPLLLPLSPPPAPSAAAPHGASSDVPPCAFGVSGLTLEQWRWLTTEERRPYFRVADAQMTQFLKDHPALSCADLRTGQLTMHFGGAVRSPRMPRQHSVALPSEDDEAAPATVDDRSTAVAEEKSAKRRRVDAALAGQWDAMPAPPPLLPPPFRGPLGRR